MCSRPIIVVGVTAKDPAEMYLARDHDAVETFSPDRAD